MTKAEIAQKEKDQRRIKKIQAKRQRLVFFCLCLAILGVAGVSVWSGLGALETQAARKEELKAQIQEAEHANSQIALQLEYMKTDDYIRAVARDQLGLVGRGEIRFVAKP